MSVAAIVLAAGKGTRMKSAIPKILHPICGLPMVEHVVNNLRAAGIQQIIVVVGPDGLDIDLGSDVKYVTQEEQLGTGHAVMQAEKVMEGYTGQVLVITGDAPLYRWETLRALVDYHLEGGALATVLTVDVHDPTGYGRIIRDVHGDLERVVEQRDANPTEALVKEINSGTFVFASAPLFEALRCIRPQNVQHEYYLPDVLTILKEMSNGKVQIFKHRDPEEALGINNRVQLAEAEQILRDRVREAWMRAGVTMMDPATIYIDATAQLAPDVVLMPFTFIEGNTTIASGSVIGPFTRLQDVTVGENVTVSQATVIDSILESQCDVGPYSYIRPGCHVGSGAKVGGFCEIKNTTIGCNSKVPHLSYIGDTHMGSNVNIGAGTITCNFDGTTKHHTTIQDKAFVGSNCNLVAPVEVGAGAYIAAGSTITGDVPSGALAVARGRQRNIPDWATRWGKKRLIEEES